MSRPIYRTVTLTVAFGCYVDERGERCDFVESIYEGADESKAARILRKRTGRDNLVVTHVETSTDRYKLELEEYLEHATLCE